jgi:hypothetical protein
MLPYKFMIDAAFADPALIVCIWLNAAAVAALEFDASFDATFAVAPSVGLAACAIADPEAVVVVVGAMLESVELIEIS